MQRFISRTATIAIVMVSLCAVGCGGSTEAVKLESPDGIDWTALEKQEETHASEMNRSEK